LTTGSRTILNTVKSSQTGTLPCVRAIWDASGSEPIEAEASVLALPEVVVDLARLVVLAQLAVLADLLVLLDLAHLTQLVVLVDLAPLEREADLPAEEVSVEAVHRSFSAAMVGNLPSTGTPRYSPVPRSGRRANRHPCQLA
jgi:hypothetical protein